MYPVCLARVALVVAGATSTGRLITADRLGDATRDDRREEQRSDKSHWRRAR